MEMGMGMGDGGWGGWVEIGGDGWRWWWWWLAVLRPVVVFRCDAHAGCNAINVNVSHGGCLLACPPTTLGPPPEEPRPVLRLLGQAHPVARNGLPRDGLGPRQAGALCRLQARVT